MPIKTKPIINQKYRKHYIINFLFLIIIAGFQILPCDKKNLNLLPGKKRLDKNLSLYKAHN